MSIPYDFHLNFEALHKSTDELESLLNKYRCDNNDIEYIYQNLKPLFDEIHSNQLKKAIEGTFGFSRMITESGLENNYPDLGKAYAIFCWDVKGLTDAPGNDELDARIRKAQQEELARRAALKDNQ